ncbi:RNA polymerase sigma factor SigZ [Kiloniella sp.]|uniref:RNA polymerase sigma factor SigZ n=1 Tax=Kiloniella sp. TaxID=1938587 RepID=UPI003A95C1D2
MLDMAHVWTEYRAVLKAFLHSKVSNPTEVEDLLQEILIKTHENLKSIKSESSLKSWLFQIANNTIIDFYREKSKAGKVRSDDLWYGQEEAGNEFGLAGCVKPFIQALPFESAELLTAIDIKGEEQKSYAARKGIKYSTLKSRVQKSRQELKGLFEDCCYLTFDYSGTVVNYVEKSTNCKKC